MPEKEKGLLGKIITVSKTLYFFIFIVTNFTIFNTFVMKPVAY